MTHADSDVLIIGGGPTGLACAIEAKALGLSARVVEKGTLVDSIRRFPVQMTFFTTGELLEIGGVPITIAESKPNRAEALSYYRAVVRQHDLDVVQNHRVDAVEGEDGRFLVRAINDCGDAVSFQARRVVVATGYYDNPNQLGVKGEELSHVSHYYREAHESVDRDVVIVGGGNSAAEAALEIMRAGGRVTMVVRKSDFNESIKYWVLPDIRNRIEAGEIQALFSSIVREIRPHSVTVEDEGGGSRELAADQVFLLVGYHPDVHLLGQIGISLDEETLIPSRDPETFESDVKGVFLAGSVTAGKFTSEIFIENGRFHAGALMPHLARSLEE